MMLARRPNTIFNCLSEHPFSGDKSKFEASFQNLGSMSTRSFTAARTRCVDVAAAPWFSAKIAAKHLDRLILCPFHSSGSTRSNSAPT
jgi:hypothetical protein